MKISPKKHTLFEQKIWQIFAGAGGTAAHA
jgi:hypothetical protein